MQTKECSSPPGPTRIESSATIVADLQYTLKEIQGKGLDEAVSSALGKKTKQALRWLEIL